MLGTVQYTPVTLDPNTADPFLALSDDLTSVIDSGRSQQLPDNPERFVSCGEMLGSRGFGSGRHTWDVEVGDNANWMVGVASRRAERKALVPACPGNGFWGVSLRDGEYEALESPSVPLPLREKLRGVRVQLDWDAGRVSFSDPADGAPLYTFRHPFAEEVYPYFCTTCESHPLRLVPVEVRIRVEDPTP
ncbi:hypothetical protein MATL_G00001680 [Megalops atlanticus]|uniref:B30.2/SPRY domain-containing protein n=1 Tax=Megalops atlanticus TaxID=7932 RepID=A0A9D3QIP0_MEGAT|nr:hypothetical protein MATL_G00001680 [Megalops atlanticus]